VPVPVPYPSGWYDGAFAAGVAVTATVGVAAAAASNSYQTVVTAPPPNCVPVVVNNITYQQCGSTWYKPQYVGTELQYVPVPPPR